MDIWPKQKRSEVMSKIRGKNTKPEMILRSQLFKDGFRFRVNKKDLPGKPDIVLPRYKTAIFVNGCFWHLHKRCKEGNIPKSNKIYWKTKLFKNVQRDRSNIKQLRRLGWHVLTFWECEIENHLPSLISKIEKHLIKRKVNKHT